MKKYKNDMKPKIKLSPILLMLLVLRGYGQQDTTQTQDEIISQDTIDVIFDISLIIKS
jgi:hypothetical protein